MGNTTVRQIVHIDESRCNGCGVCVSPCAEGAIQIIDGKAKVVREELCDGAGFCLGVCPTGALTIEERETVAFDHHAVDEHVAEKLAAAKAAGEKAYIPQSCFKCGTTEDQKPLLPVRTEGKSTWVCVHCLPALIHG